MELLVLLALFLLGLSSVLIRRGGRGKAPPAPVPVVVHKISDPAVAHRVLVQDADAFSNRPVMPFFSAQANGRGGRLSQNVSSAPYGPHWRVLRCNITAETLHPSRLGHLPALQREAIQDLVAGLSSLTASGKEPRAVAVRDHLELAVFRVVSRLCFGDGVDDRHVRAMCCVIKAFHITIGALNPSGSSTLASKLAQWRQQRRLLALHRRMTELCLPLIAARGRRQGPNNDGGCRPYVDSFLDLRVPDDGGDTSGIKAGGRRALTDDEMVNLVVEFLGAGAGTVAACLEWTLAHLVSRPEAQEKLRREVDGEAAVAAVSPNRSQLVRGMPYMHAVILESLRMHPPAPFAQRQVQAGVDIGGAAAPAGSDVFVLFVLGDIGRDSKTWKDPDEFWPERFLAGGDAEGVGPLPGPKETRMIPFGAGHRFCPGVGLAMVIIKCFLAALVREFEWAPPTNAVVDLTELDGFLKMMRRPLTARLTRRT